MALPLISSCRARRARSLPSVEVRGRSAAGTLEGMADDPGVRKPIGDVLGGLEIHPLTSGGTALEAFVLVKLLDEAGHTTWAYRTTHQLNLDPPIRPGPPGPGSPSWPVDRSTVT